MPDAEGYYTLKGYALHEAAELTPAMEDYLEMIVRMDAEQGPLRVGALSRLLHVQPSSVTKMLRLLDHGGYLLARPYGEVQLTEKGRETGAWLLQRHEIVHAFLCALNGTAEELEQTEKIEHFLEPRTVESLRRLTERLAGGLL